MGIGERIGLVLAGETWHRGESNRGTGMVKK